MIVKELIKELENCNQNAKVSIVVGDEYQTYHDSYNIEIHHAECEEYIELFTFVK